VRGYKVGRLRPYADQYSSSEGTKLHQQSYVERLI
jgi:hypothetical protein